MRRWFVSQPEADVGYVTLPNQNPLFSRIAGTTGMNIFETYRRTTADQEPRIFEMKTSTEIYNDD